MEAGRVSLSSLLVHGVELSYREAGSGPPVICLHETATSGEIWRPLAEALGAGVRVIAPDRRGWGSSGVPEPYTRTTIEEQAEDAAALLEQVGARPAAVCGAGLGAVAALDLLLRRPDLIRAALLIEPPLLAFVSEATEGLSADRRAIQEAVAGGGPEAALDLYLRGGLPFLGAGAERIPEEIGAAARRRPLSLFAELAAVPAWSLPFSEMAEVQVPTRIVVGASTPAVLRAASEQLSGRLGGTEPVEVEGEGLPHLGAASELAGVVRQLLRS